MNSRQIAKDVGAILYKIYNASETPQDISSECERLIPEITKIDSENRELRVENARLKRKIKRLEGKFKL